MRKILAYTLLAITTLGLGACSNDSKSTWDAYEDWRNDNTAWLNKQATATNSDGTPLFTRYTPSWNPTTFVYMRHIEPANTQNLRPLYTSTTKVNYQVHLYNDTLIDRGTAFISKLNDQGLIAGWAVAQMNMHVGDTCEIIMPYESGYGESGSGTVPPYSTLRFNIRLVDIPTYEIRP